MKKILFGITTLFVVMLFVSCLAPGAVESAVNTKTIWELKLVSVEDVNTYENKLSFNHATVTAPAGKIYKEITVNCKNITEKEQTLSMSNNGIKLYKNKGAVGISEVYSGGLSNYCTVASGESENVTFIFEVAEGTKLTKDSYIQVFGWPGEKTLTLTVSE